MPKSNKGRRFPPEPLSADEVRRLLEATPRAAATGIRNRALLGLLYSTGLRIAEALALYPKDVERAAGSVRVMHGKGDKSRTVGIDDAALELLDAWLELRRRREWYGNVPLFCTLQGGRLATSYVRAMLPRLARRAGVEKRVHAHGLRHTLAAELRGEGVEIGVISKALGHSSIATTAHYLDHVAPAAVVKAMRSRSRKFPQ